MTRERYLTDAELERFMAAVRTRRHVHLSASRRYEHVAPETIRAAMEATTTEA